MRILTASAVAILVVACLNPAAAQSITGRIVDGDTNNRIKAAEVMIVQIDSSSRTIADSLGAFRVRAIPGMWTLRVSALGYETLVTPPMQVGEKEHLSIVVVMTSKPLELPPVTVIARSNRALSRLDEFYQRKRKNAFGYFIDQKQIEKMGGFFVSDLLRRTPGAWVERNRVSMRGCDDAQYLIDGMPVYPMAGETPTEAANAIVSPEDIAGIEVYRGDATIPLELQLHTQQIGVNHCGLIAIWTKR